MSLLATLEADAAKAAKYAAPMAKGLAIIAAAVGLGAEASVALPVIVAVIETLGAGVAADVNADTVLAELSKFSGGLTADDAAADASVVAKFPASKP